MRPSARPVSVLLTLLYLLLAAGGEVLAHAWSDAAPVTAESHVHAPGDAHDDCPVPPHDDEHCPACMLSGLRFLSSSSESGAPASAVVAVRAPAAAAEPARSLRSDAPPRSRGPPLG